MLYITSLALLLVVACNGQRTASSSTQSPAINQPLQPLPDYGRPLVSKPVETPAPATDATEATPHDAVCANRNGYYNIDGSCDTYVECIDYRAINKACPDGLNFNPNVHWPEFPCRYPTEVPCLKRSVQHAQPTQECPHQFGLFPSDDASSGRCGQYKICESGKAVIMNCPTGLAFNPAIGQCDWPELVPSCNVTEFIGFQCPPAPLDAFGKPIPIVQNYKHEGVCYYFFSCELGKARLLSCDHGFGFDPTVGRCVNADLVQCYRDEDLGILKRY